MESRNGWSFEDGHGPSRSANGRSAKTRRWLSDALRLETKCSNCNCQGRAGHTMAAARYVWEEHLHGGSRGTRLRRPLPRKSRALCCRCVAFEDDIAGLGIDLGTARSAVSSASSNGFIATLTVLTDCPIPSKRRLAVTTTSQRALSQRVKDLLMPNNHASRSNQEHSDSSPDSLRTAASSLLASVPEHRALSSPLTTVVAVPSSFTSSQIQAIKTAIKSSSTSSIQIALSRVVREPIAAAIACGFGDGRNFSLGGFSSSSSSSAAANADDTDETVLVFDLGAGTADCAVVDVGRGVYEEIAQRGSTSLGGLDFDKRVAQLIARRSGSDGHVSEHLARSAKEDACMRGRSTLTINNCDSITITAEDIDIECADLVDQCADLVHKTLVDAREEGCLANKRLDGAVVLGGGSAMQSVRNAVESAADVSAKNAADDDGIISRGAAVIAGVAAGVINRQNAINLDENATSEDMESLLKLIESIEDGV